MDFILFSSSIRRKPFPIHIIIILLVWKSEEGRKDSVCLLNMLSIARIPWKVSSANNDLCFCIVCEFHFCSWIHNEHVSYDCGYIAFGYVFILSVSFQSHFCLAHRTKRHTATKRKIKLLLLWSVDELLIGKLLVCRLCHNKQTCTHTERERESKDYTNLAYSSKPRLASPNFGLSVLQKNMWLPNSRSIWKKELNCS